jgi:Domain of unknown function (DUF4389)
MTEGQGPSTPPPPPSEPPAPPPPPPPGYQPPAATGGEQYPLRADIHREVEYARFMPLVKWFILIPHYIALIFLGIAAAVVILISFFAVLILGRYPEGMFNFVVGVHRWGWRVGAYLLLMADTYPPFTLDDVPEYPAHFTIDYPERTARWRPLVSWLLVIPYAIVATLLMYLAEIMAFFAFFTILFTKKFPEGLFKIAYNGLLWYARASAYEYWLTTKYPPFEWEGEVPTATPQAP